MIENKNITSIRSLLPISLAVAAAYGVALWGLYLQPQLLAPLAERFQTTEAEIGQTYGIENLLYCLSMLLSVVLVTRFSRTKLAIFGTLLVILGSIASAYVGSINMFMICRVTVSFGSGITASAGNASAAGSKLPDRVYAIAGIIYALVFSIGRWLIPVGLDSFGVSGIYLSIAVFSAISIPAYFLLYPPVKGETSDFNFLKTVLDAPYRVLAFIAMFGLLIYELGQNAVFTYMDKLGEDAGVDASERGFVYLFSFSMDILGGVLATWLGTRFGRFWPLAFGLGSNIISSAMFAMVTNPDYYVYLYFLWGLSYSFTVPYIGGTMASLDKQGRWAVIGDAFWNFAATPGPVIATFIVTYGGYNPLALWVFTSGAVGMVLFCYTGKQTDKLGLVE